MHSLCIDCTHLVPCLIVPISFFFFFSLVRKVGTYSKGCENKIIFLATDLNWQLAQLVLALTPNYILFRVEAVEKLHHQRTDWSAQKKMKVELQHKGTLPAIALPKQEEASFSPVAPRTTVFTM